jgi:hypothetical protein
MSKLSFDHSIVSPLADLSFSKARPLLLPCPEKCSTLHPMEAIFDKLSTVAISDRRVRDFRDRLKMSRRDEASLSTLQAYGAAVNIAISYHKAQDAV